MAINLSFKAWPFLSINKQSQDPLIKQTVANNDESDIFGFQIPIFSNEYAHMKSFLQSINPLQNDENVPDTNLNLVNYHLSSWGPCGLFACTFDSTISIFSNDNRGCLTPILMFSPFEKYTFDRISKQPSKGAIITAIAWANGHLEPSIPKPFLAISSDKGYLYIYNVKTQNVVNTFNFNEPIVSILWSSFKVNRFYAGSSTGHFYICEVYKKNIEIIKMFEFSENISIISDDTSRSVDFITQDDVDGLTVVIASKDGTIGIIQNLNDPTQSRLHIITNLNYSINNKKTTVNLKFFEFYPNNQNFVLISTDTTTFIFYITRPSLVPFINKPNIRFISVIDSENDSAIVGDSDGLTVWKLFDKKWSKTDILKIPEIVTFSKQDDKILLTTVSNWLTQIEIKRNKLFVTKRFRLLINRKPIDYDFGDGTIVFLSKHNTLCLTTKTPESIVRSKFGQGRSNEEEKHGTSNSIDLCFNVLTKKEEEEGRSKIKKVGFISTNRLVAWCNKSIYLIDIEKRKISEPLKKMFDRLSNSITQIFFSKSCKIIGMILNHEQAYFLDTRSNLDIVHSIDFNEIIDKDCHCLFGCISPNEEEVIFASQSSLFFSKLKEKNSLKKINSSLKFNPSFVSWTDRGIIIGTEKGSAFLIKNKKLQNLSENSISKKDVKVIYDSLHNSENKMGPIKSIIYFNENKSYLIIDSNGQSIILSSKEGINYISDNIENLKKCSNDTFLISFENYNKLIVINKFEDFIPHLPPSFYLAQKENISFYSNKNELFESFKDKNKVNSIVHRIFSTKFNCYSKVLKNNIHFLNTILSFYDAFNFLSSRLCLKLGKLELAKNILLKSNRNDKEYVNNLLIASFFNSGSEKVESAKIIIKSLIDNKMIHDASDILLITKDVYAAINVLYDSGKFKDAYYLLMLNGGDGKDSEKMNEIAKKVASSLIDKKENILLGLKLLASFGFTNEMLDQLSQCLT